MTKINVIRSNTNTLLPIAAYSANNHTLEKPKVLLVEDNMVIQKVHTSLLELLGCQVDLAATGHQAVVKACQKYDLILMDIGLPDMSGLEVAATIRQQETDSIHNRIIALTTFSPEDIYDECQAVGIEIIVTKPISPTTLQQLVYYNR